jgi:hypothetical protein
VHRLAAVMMSGCGLQRDEARDFSLSGL